MTLLELCDELNASLIVERKHKKDKVVYSVCIQRVQLYKWFFPDSYRSSFNYEPATAHNSDVNKALYSLCNKVSHKYAWCRGKAVYAGKVEKGNLSILGVW